MRQIYRTALLSTFILTVCWLSAEENVKYTAKKFSGKALDNKSYSAKPYNSDKAPKDKPFAQSSKKPDGFWSFFGIGKKKEYATLPEQKQKKSENYKRDERITLKVEHPDDKALKEAKNLSDTTELDNKNYKPPDKKRGRDPMLRPRHGIKAPLVKEE